MIPAGADKGESISSDENQFLDSADTIERLCKKVPCEKAVAESETVRRCKAGLLTSRCAKISWTETDRYGSTQYDDEEIAIPEWFWESCSDDPETIFDWQPGKIAGRGFDDDFTYKVKIEGLEFHRNEIDELAEDLKGRLRSHEAEMSHSGTSSRSGRKRSSAWNDWIAELAVHLHEKGFPDGEGAEGQDELIAAVEARMAEGGLECLSRSSVQPVARAVLLRYRSAKN